MLTCGSKDSEYAWMPSMSKKARFWKDILLSCQRKVYLSGSPIDREGLAGAASFPCGPIRNISKKNLSIYLNEKRKVFSRFRGAKPAWRCESINGSSFQTAVHAGDRTAAVLSNNKPTIGERNGVVEAFSFSYLVFSKLRLSVEFRCALCIDMHNAATIYFNNAK